MLQNIGCLEEKEADRLTYYSPKNTIFTISSYYTFNRLSIVTMDAETVVNGVAAAAAAAAAGAAAAAWRGSSKGSSMSGTRVRGSSDSGIAIDQIKVRQKN